MLKFTELRDSIDCERKNGESVAIIYFAVCGRYIIETVDSFATPDELRQIADKLDELNGK